MSDKQGGSRQMGCETCGLRRAAERRPNGLLARLWRWHTGWCPGWRKYQRALLAEGRQTPAAGGKA